MRYDGARFLQRVQAHQRDVRGRTGPTGCWVCDVLLPCLGMSAGLLAEMQRMCDERSGGIVDAHHVLPKQLLKREAKGSGIDAMLRAPGLDSYPLEQVWRELGVALMDPRNGIVVRRAHHDQIESRNIAIPVALLPADTREFAEELGLLWWLENQEARRA
jgi:hypothetical protein